MTDIVKLENKHFSFAKTGLIINGQPNYEQWEAFGCALKHLEGAVHWWIGDWVNFGESAYGEKYSQAIGATGFAYGTLRDDAWVAGQYELSRRRDKLEWGYHREVANLSIDEQNRLLDRAEQEGWTRHQLREAKKALLPAPELPAGKYRIIYADPPWEYGDTRKGLKGYTGAEDHYPTMPIDELCALPIEQLAANDAVLFLWVTSPLLEECWPVIEAWGFEYRTSFIWDKVKHNVGHYNSVRHELLLICTRGSCVPDTKKLFDSVQVIERTEKHSEKPEEFRTIIEKLYTTGPKIELFARKATEGWETYGNELPQ